MKILIVTQYFWPENFRINGLVQSLAQRGHTIEVLTGKPNYPDGAVYYGYRAWGCKLEYWKGIKIYRIPIIARGKKNGARLAMNYFSFVGSGLLIAPWMLINQKYDVIFIYAPSPIFQAVPASFLGWLKKSPVALWVQDIWPESAKATGYINNALVLKLIEKMVRFVYRHVDLLLVPSRAFQPLVVQLAPGKVIEYYPNSIDSTFYNEPNLPLPSVPWLTRNFSVLFAGNVGIAQAMQVIVDAAEILRDRLDIHFVILGKGSRWDWMNAEIEMRGLINVHLLGEYPIEMMPGFMRQASSLLVTLAAQPILDATIPSKVQAYMAIGKPILACMNGEGARLIEEAHAGITAPAENAAALADAVLRLYEMSPEDQKEMGENGKMYYKKHFDHERLADKLINRLQALSVSFGEKI